MVESLPLYWDSCHVQWPRCLVPFVWDPGVRHFFIHRKFTLSDHLFSNYFAVPASRKLSALVMWTRSWVCNQGQCLMLGTFSYPLKDEGRVNYYPAELIGFRWIGLGFCMWWYSGAIHKDNFLSCLRKLLKATEMVKKLLGKKNWSEIGGGLLMRQDFTSYSCYLISVLHSVVSSHLQCLTTV